jgi:hypothetical protein
MKRVLALVAVACALLAAACGGHHHAGVSSIKTTSSTTSALPQGPGNRAPNFGRTPPWWNGQPKAIAPGASVEQLDAVGISAIPAGWPYVAGYTNGNWPTVNLLLHAFPHSHILTIAVNTSGRADCLDIEPGDAVPSEAAGWVRADRALTPRPCIYAPLYLWQDVWANLNANEIPRSSVWEWDAHWDYFAHIDSGFDATQWTDSALGKPHALDESTVSAEMINGFFGPPSKPVNPHHYKWLPDARRSFREAHDVKGKYVAVTVHARERQAVINWDKWGCRTPTKRTKCREMFHHMFLLDGRVQHIAHHSPNLKHAVKRPRWGAIHYRAKDGHKTTLGGANQQLLRRLSTKHHGVVTNWS